MDTSLDLSRMWNDDGSELTDEQASEALNLIGADLAAGIEPRSFNQARLEDLIRLCRHFALDGRTVAASYASELWEAAKTLAPWSAGRLVEKAVPWRLVPTTDEGRADSLVEWGERLSKYGELLPGTRGEAQLSLLRDALRLPNDHGLPDSCADEPTAGDELLLRLHTCIDNRLHGVFRTSRLVLGVLAAIGVCLVAAGLLWAQSPAMGSSTAGLSVLAVVGATYVRRMVSLRLSIRSVAAARAMGNAILGAAALQAVIVGVWTIENEGRGALTLAVLSVAVTIVTSVSAGYSAELAANQLAEASNRPSPRPQAVARGTRSTVSMRSQDAHDRESDQEAATICRCGHAQ